jgi:hypothetical protein
MSRGQRHRFLAVFVAGVVAGSVMLTPAGAHVGGTLSHLIGHLKDTFYTKAQSNKRFVNVGESERWREVGTPGQPGFLLFEGSHVWTNLGGVHNTVAFYRDPLGVVHLKGVAKCILQDNCSTASIFTLPPEYRPAAQEAFPVLTGTGLARVDVTSTGVAVLRSPSVLTHDWVTLDGITFRAA